MSVGAFAALKGAMDRLKERDLAKTAALEAEQDAKREKELKFDLITQKGNVDTQSKMLLLQEEDRLKRAAEERARRKNEKTIGGSYQDPINFMGTEIMSAQEVAANPDLTPFTINMIGTTENDFQGFNLGIVDKDDAQKTQLNKDLSDGSEFSQKFLKNYRTGLAAFMMKTRGTEGPAGNVRQHVVMTGVPILDKMINEVVYTPEYKNLVSNREYLQKNPLVAYQTTDGYFIGTEKDAEGAEGITPVQSYLFSHPYTKMSYGSLDKYKNGPVGIGLDLYRGVLLADADADGSKDASPYLLDMTRADNISSYKRNTGNPDSDAKWNTNKGSGANTKLATAILDSTPYRFMEWDGTDFLGGPQKGEAYVDFLDKRTNELELGQKFLIKGGLAKNLLANLLDVGRVGAFVAPFDSFAETLGTGLINYFSVGEDSVLYRTITDNILNLADSEDVKNITSKVSDMTLNDLQNLYGEGTDTQKRASSIFGSKNIYQQRFTEEDLEAGKTFLAENKSIVEKARAGQVLNSRERYKAAVFSMAYTYASYVQGGTGGTRTVSDADIIYALKMLGLTPGGKGTPNSTEVKTLGSSIQRFNDRYNEIVRESIPNALLLNSDVGKYPVKTHEKLKNLVANYTPEDIGNLVHVAGGTQAQDAEYALADAYRKAYKGSGEGSAEERQQLIIDEFKQNPKVINDAIDKIIEWTTVFATDGANADSPKRIKEANNYKGLLRFIVENKNVFGEELVNKSTSLQAQINEYYK